MDQDNLASFYSSQLLSKCGVSHGFFTRQTNEHISHPSLPSAQYLAQIAKNRERWLKALSVNDTGILYMECANEDKILDAKTSNVFNVTTSGYDAVMTRSDKSAIAFGVADCVPIILYEPNEKLIGVVHAGWRGTKSNIAGRTIDKMMENYHIDSKNIVAVIGPAICGRCYEVKDDVGKLFAKKYRNIKNEKIYLDLIEANSDQLKTAGVEQIDRINICTFENTHIFYSYRKENTPKRFCVVIAPVK